MIEKVKDVSELVQKLWSVVKSRFIKTPEEIRQEGYAYADVRRREMLTIAQAERDCAAISRGEKELLPNGDLVNVNVSEKNNLPSSVIPDRDSLCHAMEVSKKNADIESLRKELTLIKATLYAEQELQQDNSEAPQENPSDDWLLRWREYASGVSSNELHQIWGKVLAGEIKSPGYFSMRTLNLIRDLSTEDALFIEKAYSLVVDNEFVLKDYSALESNGFSIEKMLELQELGILFGVESHGLLREIRSVRKDCFECSFLASNKGILVTHEDPMKKITLTVFGLTSMAKQLMSLCRVTSSDSMLDALIGKIKNDGFTVKSGHYEKVDGITIKFHDLVER